MDVASEVRALTPRPIVGPRPEDYTPVQPVLTLSSIRGGSERD